MGLVFIFSGENGAKGPQEASCCGKHRSLESDDLGLILAIANCYSSLNLDFLIPKIGVIIPALLSS